MENRYYRNFPQNFGLSPHLNKKPKSANIFNIVQSSSGIAYSISVKSDRMTGKSHQASNQPGSIKL
ncbi:hypothetical protein BCD67_11420 [Oscillatoriales cyanobacterium USR001]|nr:hypothetical protein BCD67_11420 [Oscillatoriales cyanobacterium USR001]